MEYPVGFVNTGSLCYLNSMIQSLLSCAPLNEFLLANEKKYRTNKLLNTYINILKKVKCLEGITTCIDDNVELLRNILEYQQSSHFGFSQEDASECFLLFLDSVNDKNIEKFFYHKYKCNIVCLNCNDNQQIQQDTSCQFSPNQSDVDLIKFLSFNSSKLEGYTCTKCQTTNDIYKSNILIEIPPIVIITINKFTQKFNTNYPEVLSFNAKNKLVYKLASCIEHYGNMFSGHYICKSKRNSGVYLFNDASFSLSNLDINNNTYILVYILVK